MSMRRQHEQLENEEPGKLQPLESASSMNVPPASAASSAIHAGEIEADIAMCERESKHKLLRFMGFLLLGMPFVFIPTFYLARTLAEAGGMSPLRIMTSGLPFGAVVGALLACLGGRSMVSRPGRPAAGKRAETDGIARHAILRIPTGDDGV